MKEHLSFPCTLAHTSLALLVDRDADTRRIYAEYLQAVSCDNDEAEDGREALAKTHQPVCVVTETRLSGINGFEFCELLRRDDATRRASIVFVTGEGFARHSRRAEAAGADSLPMMSRAFVRRSTEDPLARPPTLVCPDCDQLLTYLVSHIGA